MLKHIGVIIWAVSTILLATAFTIGYNKSHEEAMAVEYRCYLSIHPKEGWYEGESTPKYTRSELEEFKTLKKVGEFNISNAEMNSRSVEFKFNTTDNPDLLTSRMTCYGG